MGQNKAGKKTSRSPRPRSRGALATIGLLLISSAVVRTVIGAGEAFALEEAALEAQPVASETVLPPAQATQRLAESDFRDLLNALNAREARVKKREEDIDIRMQALAVAEQEIDRRLQALEGAEKRLRETLALAQDAAENDIAQLTTVYANMKPKQAAALFEEMDPEFSAGFLARMRPDSAAAIMAGLSPEVAYTISVILAGRNANVPKQ